MTIEWHSAAEYGDIMYEKAEGIAKITINRPEVHNAFRPQTIDEMSEAFADAHADPEIGVVLLTGAGAQEPLHDRLVEVRAPTLLLAGALDLKYAAIASEMSQQLPNATMQLIDGAGHAAHLERPQQFSRPVLDFLRRTYPEVEATART